MITYKTFNKLQNESIKRNNSIDYMKRHLFEMLSRNAQKREFTLTKDCRIIKDIEKHEKKTFQPITIDSLMLVKADYCVYYKNAMFIYSNGKTYLLYSNNKALMLR